MTLDEAINKLEHGIEQLTMELKSGLWEVGSDTENAIKEGIKDNEQLIAWLIELKEAKRLLKAAIEDLNATATEVYNGGVICECCKWESQIGKCSCPDDGGCDTDYQWRYADEALKLIGED